MSTKVVLAMLLAVVMIAVFTLQLFAADKVSPALMPAISASVNAYQNGTADSAANMSSFKFSLANNETGEMAGKVSVPLLFVYNSAVAADDKSFLVYSMNGTQENPAAVAELHMKSARIATMDQYKEWLISSLGVLDAVGGGDVLVPAYTNEGTEHAEVTWRSLVQAHGPVTNMVFSEQGILDPADPTDATIIAKNNEEFVELFNQYDEVTMRATSATFQDGTIVTADDTETEKALAEALEAGLTPPAAPTVGSWLISVIKSTNLRNSGYVTGNYTADASNNGVAWVANHSFPTIPIEDLFADAGTSYTSLVEHIQTNNSVSADIAIEYARLFTYATIQYAIWYHTGYFEPTATAGVNAVLGNEMTVGMDELKAVYSYLTRDRDYADYTTKTMDNNLKLVGLPASSSPASETNMNPNATVTQSQDDEHLYYGPFMLDSDLFTAGNVNLTLGGFETLTPTGGVVLNTPVLTKEGVVTPSATLTVRQGEEFYIAVHEEYSDNPVSGLTITTDMNNGVKEGTEKSRMFLHVRDDMSDPICTSLAVGATTAAADATNVLNLPTLAEETGRALTFSASGVNNTPLEGVQIQVSTGSPTTIVATGPTNAAGQYIPTGVAFEQDATYTYKELSVPDGYALNTNTYSITVGPDNVPETIPNVKTSVTIRKLRASDHTTPMPGATIGIYGGTPSALIDYYNNDNNGAFSITGLPWGNYTYREQLATGVNTYTPTGDIYSFAIAQNGDNSGTLVFYGADDVEPGKATIRVVDDAGNPIANSTVAIYEGGANASTTPITTLTSNAQGYVTTPELDPGDYVYVQTTVPDGYTLNTTRQSFEVENDGKITPTPPTNIVSNRVRKSVSLKAYNTVSNAGVPNVSLAVFKTGTTDETLYTTGTDGTIAADLYYGEYTLYQKSAVTGYTTNSNRYYFTVASSTTGDTKVPLTPASSSTGGGGSTGGTVDTSTGTFSVLGGDTQTALSGAKVAVYNASGAVVYEGTTGTDGKITIPSTLAAGTYTYKQVGAPSGYSLNSYTFTFTKSAQNVYTGLANISSPVVTVIVKKTDSKGTTPLSGATLTLYSSAGTSLDTKTTGSDGLATFTKIAYGSYYIKETAAPTGYTLSSEVVSFTLDATYTNKEATVLKNSKTVQTGGEMAFVYGTICVLAISGAAYLYITHRKARA